MYVSEICAEGIFITFPWWLKNVKSRSKIALFSNERHFEIWFPKEKTITFFWSKLSKLHKKDPILHVTTTFSLKQGETRTSHGVQPFWCTKQFCILQLPISYCVSLIMVTILTRHVFINIFQMKHLSAVKFVMGYGKNMSFLVKFTSLEWLSSNETENYFFLKNRTVHLKVVKVTKMNLSSNKERWSWIKVHCSLKDSVSMRIYQRAFCIHPVNSQRS